VLAGIGPDDNLIINPADSIADGQEVRIQPQSPPSAPGTPAGGHAS
jgi:hypothetical protein